jgi:hypothetical protein
VRTASPHCFDRPLPIFCKLPFVPTKRGKASTDGANRPSARGLARNGSGAAAFTPRHGAGDIDMTRTNSGGGKSSNNTGNPTLEEHQEKKGVSGNAIRGEKKVNAKPNRGPTRMSSP